MANQFSLVSQRAGPTPWLLLLPPLLLIALCLGLPLANLLIMLWQTVANSEVLLARLREPWITAAVRFTLWQAAMSAIITTLLGILVSKSLAIINFPGKQILLAISAVPFALPSIIVAFAFVIVYGNSGFIAPVMKFFGLSGPLLYNKWAIVAAHVFFNLPFAMRLFLATLTEIPLEIRRSAELHGFSSLQQLIYVEWPYLARPIISMALLTFCLSLTSFAIAMTLGGSPELNTTEVAIYQFLRFDYDPQAATVLAGIQLVLTLAASALYFITGSKSTKLKIDGNKNTNSQLGSHPQLVSNKPTRALRLLAITAIFGYGVFLLLPFTGMLMDALGSLGSLTRLGHRLPTALTHDLAPALTNSIILGLSTAVIAALAAFAFIRSLLNLSPFYPSFTRTMIQGTWLLVGVSPTVLSFSWFLFFTKINNSFDFSWSGPLVLCVHLVIAFPFAARILQPAIEKTYYNTERGVKLLGLSSWRSFWLVEFPALRVPLILAAAVGFALSFGETAAAMLFANEQFVTIPVLILKLMGAYRFAEASLLSVVLAALCTSIFIILERIEQ